MLKSLPVAVFYVWFRFFINLASCYSKFYPSYNSIVDCRTLFYGLETTRPPDFLFAAVLG